MIRWTILVLLFARAAWADAPAPSFGSPFRFTEVGGAAVYAGACAGCHMAGGQGASGAGAYPALAGDPRLASSAYAVTRVLQGRGAMPPFGNSLSDEQVAGVVGYIRASFGNAYGPGPAAAEVAALR